MKPLTQKQFGNLRRKRLAVCHPLNFLDEHKIGLHLDYKARVLPEKIDLNTNVIPENFVEIDLRQEPLLPGRKYLGTSTQHISLPGNVWGMLHTRSTLARFGIDLFGSSYYISPGFGAEVPTPIVYEISVSSEIIGIPFDEPVAGMLLFTSDTDSSLWRGKGRHAFRFPFSQYIPRAAREDD